MVKKFLFNILKSTRIAIFGRTFRPGGVARRDRYLPSALKLKRVS